MFKQRTFVPSIIIISLVAVLNYIGITFRIYDRFEPYDIPMHFLGGLGIALLALWIVPTFYSPCSISNYKIKSFFINISAVIVIAILWELFEIIGGITDLQKMNYWNDTRLDVLCAFIGSIVAQIYFTWRKDNCYKCVPDSLVFNNLSTK